MRLRWRRRRDLAERLRPYLPDRLPPAKPMVDADPIRMFLYRWMIETGDPIEVVAKGFDLRPGLVHDLIEGHRKRLSESEAACLTCKLQLGDARWPT